MNYVPALLEKVFIFPAETLLGAWVFLQVLLCAVSVAACAHLGTQVHDLLQPGPGKPRLSAPSRVSPPPMESGRLAGGDDGGGGGRSKESREGSECGEEGN